MQLLNTDDQTHRPMLTLTDRELTEASALGLELVLTADAERDARAKEEGLIADLLNYEAASGCSEAC